MNFIDFTPEQLIGKWVLYESRYHRAVKQIRIATASSFRIADYDDLFNIVSGFKRGKERFDTTHCMLISEEQAVNIMEKWKIKAEEKVLREQIIVVLPSANKGQLMLIMKILKK